MKKLSFLVTSIILSFTFSAFSFTNSWIPYASCYLGASKLYGVSPYLLIAISKVESNFNPSEIDHDSDGTVDIGIMQVNSCHHFPEQWLLNPCYNIYAGAYVLKSCINRFGVSWRAIDCYNKGPGGAHRSSYYVWKVYKAYLQLVQSLTQLKNELGYQNNNEITDDNYALNIEPHMCSINNPANLLT